MSDLFTPFTEGLEECDVSFSTSKARCDPKHVDEDKPLDDKLPSVVTDGGRDDLAKDTKSKKGIIGSKQIRNHNVFTYYPKDPSCEVCEKTKTTRARCRLKQQTALLFLHTLFRIVCAAKLFKSRLQHFVNSPQSFTSLLCVSRTDILGYCRYSATAMLIATAVLGKKSRCVSPPQSYTARITHSAVLWLQKPYTFYR